MKVKTLAFLYNVRHKYPDPDDVKTQLEVDFDDPPTIKWIIKHLKNIGYKVIPIEANEEAYLKLYAQKKEIDFAFDFSFGFHGENKYGHIPGMLEMLRIPFTSSSSFTRNLTLNKVKMKQMLIANNISTLPFEVFESEEDVKNRKLPFPLIVKPIAEGSSAGISDDSVVTNEYELKRQIRFIVKTFNEKALAEPFLSWREFSVSMLGNPPQVLPIIEPDFSLLPKKFLPLDSMEVKWIFEEQSATNHLVCPAKMGHNLLKKVHEIAHDTWHALGIKDLCRIDMRTDKHDNIFVLDVNAPPGLLPPEISTTSYFPLAARTAGIEYEDLLRMIIKAGLKRYYLH